MPIMELKGVSYIYSEKTPFEKQAIHDVDLTIEQGDFIGVIGHTGSGKSTLVQHLNGLIRPTNGHVLFHGQDVWAAPKAELRNLRFRVGMVFQYPEHQLFESIVKEDIAFGPKNMGLSADEIKERVWDAAQSVGLREELLYKSPFELSGGEKRRAAIAGVIAMNPEILVLDEPTAGLDPKGRDAILSLITEYHRAHQTTVVLVSHSMEDVARVAQKVLVMDHGKNVLFDSTEKVFERAELLTSIGLSIPAVTQICLKLREQGMDIGDGIYTVDQAVERLLPLLKGGDVRA